MLRVAAALLSLAVVAGGCSGDDADDLSAVTSIPDDATTTTSTTEPRTVAPDVIPTDESQITEEYVQQVLDAYAQAALEAFLATRDAGVVDEKAIELVSATSSEAHAQERINSLADIAREGFDGYADEPGPTRFEVRELLVTSLECVVAHVVVDSSEFLEVPVDPPPGRTMIVLIPADSEQRASALNPTAWIVDAVPVVADGDQIPDCEGTQ